MKFDWDGRKAELNLGKHGVSFGEAVSVFRDPLAAIRADTEHSLGEAREHIIGLSAQHRLPQVTFADRGDSLRIIGARVATRRERSKYEER